MPSTVNLVSKPWLGSPSIFAKMGTVSNCALRLFISLLIDSCNSQMPSVKFLCVVDGVTQKFTPTKVQTSVSGVLSHKWDAWLTPSPQGSGTIMEKGTER